MKKVLLLAFVLSIVCGAARAGGIEGYYAGVRVGHDDYLNTGPSGAGVSHYFVGGELGYNWKLTQTYLTGIDLWVDNHQRPYSGRDWGVDFKLSDYHDGDLYYYGKAGYVMAADLGSHVHIGGGVEYRVSPKMWAVLEGSVAAPFARSQNANNAKLLLGVNYRF